MKVVTSIIVICFSFYLQAQPINCDSLKREFDSQIEKAKKEKLDKVVIQQLENTKLQLIELFCNSTTTNTLPVKNSVAAVKKVAATTPGKTNNKNFIAAYKITVNVFASESTNHTTEQYHYYINAAGNTIVLNDKSFSANSSFNAATQQEDAHFDGWMMESNGTNTIFTTSTENGKIAIEQPFMAIMKFTSNNNKKPTIQLLKQTKKIAGYTCNAYSVSAIENGEKLQYTFWVTNTPLAMNHESFPFFTMFSAQAVGLPINPKNGILLIEGNNGNEKLMLEVVAIEPSIKKFAFTGYKNMNMQFNKP